MYGPAGVRPNMGEGGGLEGRRHEGGADQASHGIRAFSGGGGEGGRSCCLSSRAVRAVTAIITVMAFRVISTYLHFYPISQILTSFPTIF